MSNKYFWVSTIIIVILSLLIWDTCRVRYKEGFNQPKWEKTLRCLKFTNDDIDTFKNNLSKGEDPNIMLNKLVTIGHKNRLNNKQIIGCLTGDI